MMNLLTQNLGAKLDYSNIVEFLQKYNFKFVHNDFPCGVDMFDEYLNEVFHLYLYCYDGNNYFTIYTIEQVEVCYMINGITISNIEKYLEQS